MPKISFTVDGESLAGETILADSNALPQILILHGAGQATKERAKPLAQRIISETGQGVFTFDFSGHGESSGELVQSSLQKRVNEANATWQFLAPDKPITIFGLSMGGHIALEMLKHHVVENLVLFYPGLYTREAFDLPFDERFSNTIRKENSWQDAAVLEDLKSFRGNLLIIWGENDAVVPRGVVDLLYETAENAKSRELFVISGAEHLLLPQLYANDQLMNEAVNKIKKNLLAK